MTNMQLNQVEQMDNKSKLLVYGYIRNVEKFMSQNIPISIEKWDQKSIGNSYAIDGNTLIELRSGFSHSAFLSKIVCSNRHHQRFKIKKYDGSYGILFGIVKQINCNQNEIMKSWLGRFENTCYVFDAINK